MRGRSQFPGYISLPGYVGLPGYTGLPVYTGHQASGTAARRAAGAAARAWVA